MSRAIIKNGSGRALRRVLAALPLCAMSTFALAQEVEPKADEVLHAMSDYLAGLITFIVTADAATDVLLRNGAKMQLTATGTLVLDREKGFRVVREGPLGESTIVFDGSAVSISNSALGVHFSIPVEGNIDQAIDEVRSVLGTEVTGGADLLYANPHEGLMFEVETGQYLGEVTVGGVSAHHLFYRAKDIDWQLWVRSEGDPIPVKYVITSKWMTAAPAFSVQLWNFEPGVTTDANTFNFTPPEGSKELDPATIDGENIIGEG